MTRPQPRKRDQFRWFDRQTLRWHDNDVFQHVNNVDYYSFFDTAAARFLIAVAGLDYRTSPLIDVIAESGCRYHSQIAFPQQIEVGVAIEHLGRSSARYAFSVFADGAEISSADGFFVHVWVERATMRPTEIPPLIRAAYESIPLA